jgi:hypothetical protein
VNQVAEVTKFLELYEQGVYTFGEIMCYFIRLAANKLPEEFVGELPADFLVNIAMDVANPPKSPDEIWYRLDDGTNANTHFRGAWQLHRYLFDSVDRDYSLPVDSTLG